MKHALQYHRQGEREGGVGSGGWEVMEVFTLHKTLADKMGIFLFYCSHTQADKNVRSLMWVGRRKK